MKLSPNITIVPVISGNITFASHIRMLCNSNKYDCIIVDLPDVFQNHIFKSVENLPFITAVTASEPGKQGRIFYIPADPCDAMIEGIRQSLQKRIFCRLAGYPALTKRPPLPPLPDSYAVTKIGYYPYMSLNLAAIKKTGGATGFNTGCQFTSATLRKHELDFKNILAIVHISNFSSIIHYFRKESSYNITFDVSPEYNFKTFFINPDHLYFALGELPFATGKYEYERQNLFTPTADPIDIIKDLFRETRDTYSSSEADFIKLTPAKIQKALTFLRNLTILNKRFMPSLFDIIEAAKGVGGNNFAVELLKRAKYYPYIPYEMNPEYLDVGINKIQLPDNKNKIQAAVNILRDTDIIWRTLSIKKKPAAKQQKKYRYSWNPAKMCSHIPEDRKIEGFNSYLRKKTKNLQRNNRIKTEKFSSSIRDGIDIRETIKNWYTDDIYVKCVTPLKGNIDTVIIIFDDNHDDKYPHRTVWYAEHKNESTLSFYSTDPLNEMTGPGISRAYYGGLSLIYPPKFIPNIFSIAGNHNITRLSHQLLFGSLFFSREKNVSYIAKKKPGLVEKKIASDLNKNLIWIPLGSFSNETLQKTRRFHILNGKEVRSWAARFIEDY